MIKEKVIEVTKELPKEFNVEELIEKLIFIDKIEKGLIQLSENKTLSHEAVKSKVHEWQK